MGSKNRISKEILKFIEPYFDKDKNYYEPFVGGANMIDKIPPNSFKNIIGSDYNRYLIALLNYMKTDNEIEYEFMEKDDYYNNHKYPFHKDNENYIEKHYDWYIGYIGFTKSFSGKFMDSYSGICKRKNGRLENYQKEKHNNIIKQRENIKHIEFIHSDYKELDIEDNSVLYLDPPYNNTGKYSTGLDIFHEELYEWVKDLVYNKNCIVFISEYNMPEEFECVYEKRLSNSGAFGKTKDTEKLYILKKDKNGL